MIYLRRQEPLISYRIVSRPSVVAVLTVVHNLTTLAVSSDLTEVATNVRDTGENVHELRLSHHEKEIRDWLSAADPFVNYANALAKRHKETGLWFTEGQTFADWKKQSRSFFWLHGIPGCGKTVLSSTIIEHLKSTTTSSQVLLYFYFDFNDTKKQSLESMLRSLINQLYQGQPDARGPLDKLRKSTAGGNPQLSREVLKDVLLVMLSRVNDVSIVLDALDESSTRCELLAWLRSFVGADSIACRILVTSRRVEDIESGFKRWMQSGESVSIQQDDIYDDIRAYVMHTVRNSEEFVRWQEMPEIQDEIETELVEKADGM
jgi:Cdc6-like AAA superfamily ATPase